MCRNRGPCRLYAATVTFPCCFSNSGPTIIHHLHTFSSDHQGISIVYTVVSIDYSKGPAIVPALSQNSYAAASCLGPETQHLVTTRPEPPAGSVTCYGPSRPLAQIQEPPGPRRPLEGVFVRLKRQLQTWRHANGEFCFAVSQKLRFGSDWHL